MQTHEFIFLDDDSRELLEADINARMLYIDMLSLLHDLLIPFASQPEHSRFTSVEVFRRLADIVHAFSSTSQIGVAARKNIAMAELFHSTFGRNYVGVKSSKLSTQQSLLDEFISDLLKEYDIIRTIRSRGMAKAT